MEEVQKVIDEKINPMLKLHKGSCKVVGFDNGVVSVELQGGCAGCPSSIITLYNLIKPVIVDNCNDVTDVVVA